MWCITIYTRLVFNEVKGQSNVCIVPQPVLYLSFYLFSHLVHLIVQPSYFLIVLLDILEIFIPVIDLLQYLIWWSSSERKVLDLLTSIILSGISSQVVVASQWFFILFSQCPLISVCFVNCVLWFTLCCKSQS